MGFSQNPLRLPKVLFLLVFLAGCPGNPASPPAPPAEIPSFLTFPQTVGVDVSTIASGSSQPALVAPGGEFSDAIAEGANRAEEADDLISNLLFLIDDLEIPTSPDIKTFEVTIEPEDEFSLPLSFKIDFADYDFDGDGSAEGCTGCTCPVSCSLESCPLEIERDQLKPVCVRVWIQKDPNFPFSQMMAGRLDILAVQDDPETEENEENPGKGRFRVGRIEKGVGPDEEGNLTEFDSRVLIGAIYDHSDPVHPLDKSSEIFGFQRTVVGGQELPPSFNGHFVAIQVEKEDLAGHSYLEKSVDVVSEEEFEFGFAESLRYIGRFREGSDFWSGSVFKKEGEVGEVQSVTEDFSDVCVRLSTGNEVSGDICLDLGIDTTGEDFIAPATEADAAFPADFPEQPTF